MKKIIFSIFIFTATLSNLKSQGVIPIDYMLHAAAGYTISTSTNAILGKYGVKHSEYYGLAAGVTAGLAKELYDQKSYGYFSHSDFYFTAFGSFVGTIMFQVAIEAAEDRWRKKNKKPNPLFY